MNERGRASTHGSMVYSRRKTKRGSERARERFIENNYLRYFVADRAVIYGAGNYLQAHVRFARFALQREHSTRKGLRGRGGGRGRQSRCVRAFCTRKRRAQKRESQGHPIVEGERDHAHVYLFGQRAFLYADRVLRELMHRRSERAGKK